MNNNGVKFDDKHSLDDFKLIMTSKIINEPEMKIIKVEIPGSDGSKDLSDVFGGIKYENRLITINFDLLIDIKDWSITRRSIVNFLHGKIRKIIFDIDPNFYYKGRCKVTSFYNEKTIYKITIECDCEPYKYKLDKTSVEYEVQENNSYQFYNLFKEVIPEIILTAPLTFEYEGTEYSLSEGVHKVLNISLKEGINIFNIISGTGTMKLIYQEASL